MLEPDNTTRRQELGNFIRARRERLTPENVGLTRAGRRRTPGLRREEVAQLCGLSVTWYTWLEQGRDVALSATAITRVARALRLDRAARAYVFELAGRHDPEHGIAEPEIVPNALVAGLKAIAVPAYILDGQWNALACNARARRLFPGWLDQPGERSLLRFIFLEPAASQLICDFDERARRVAAEFRAGVGIHLADPRLRSLIEDLRRGSSLFDRLWNEHAVLGREGGLRTFRHPRDGFLSFEQLSFNVAAQPELKLTMLVPI